MIQNRVSSTLSGNAKEFGKQNMFDGSEVSCWNSDQGCPQYVMVKFSQTVSVYQFKVMFQGGFAAKVISFSESFYIFFPHLCKLYREKTIEFQAKNGNETKIDVTFHPNDNNSTQSFDIEGETREKQVNIVKLNFPQSTDFYGRVVIYKLEFFGKINKTF